MQELFEDFFAASTSLSCVKLSWTCWEKQFLELLYDVFSQLLSGCPTGPFARKSTMNGSIYSILWRISIKLQYVNSRLPRTNLKHVPTLPMNIAPKRCNDWEYVTCSWYSPRLPKLPCEQSWRPWVRSVPSMSSLLSWEAMEGAIAQTTKMMFSRVSVCVCVCLSFYSLVFIFAQQVDDVDSKDMISGHLYTLSCSRRSHWNGHDGCMISVER